ncbi:MAG: RHS repeat-associated core domain-containing protein, partial [Arenicella sp.]
VYEDAQRVVTNGLGESTVYLLGDVNGQKVISEVRGPGCSACSGGDIAYEYNDNLQVTKITYKDGNSTEYEYDERGRLTARYYVHGNGQDKRLIVKYKYAGTSNDPSVVVKPSVVSGEFYQVRFEYTQDRQISAIREIGYTPKVLGETNSEYASITRDTTFSYNSLGQLVGVDGPRKDVDDSVEISYYSGQSFEGLVHRVTGANGIVRYEVQEYDQLGRVIRARLESGEEYTLTYTDSGEVGSIDRNGLTQYFEYESGQLNAVKFSDGSELNYTYDDYGKLVKLVDGQGEGVQRTLDDDGNAVRYELLGLGGSVLSWANLQYEDGKLVKTQNKNHDSFIREYDENGFLSKLFSETESLLVEPKWLSSGIVESISLGSEKILELGYDGQSQLASVSDGNQNRTAYLYDDFKRLVFRSSPDKLGEVFSYDESNNLLKYRNAEMQIHRYGYDANNNLVMVDDGIEQSQISYTQGKLKELNTATQSQKHQYDESGRLVSKAVVIDGLTYQFHYRYNELGQLSGKTLPDGSQLHYSYDTTGHLLSVDIDAGIFSLGQSIITSQYTNDAAGQRIRQYGNGTQRQLTYDGEQLSSIRSGSLSSDYKYDGLGRIVVVNEFGKESQYKYDQHGRLIYESGGELSNNRPVYYSYDNAGNRTSLSIGEEGGELQQEIYDFSYGANNNRLLQPGIANQYNSAGSLINDGVYRYEYTPGQQISKVFKSDSLIAEYHYNLWGERAKKTIYVNGEPRTTYFLYEAKRLVAEANENGNITRQYFYINQPIEDWSEGEVRRRLHVFQKNMQLAKSESGQRQKLNRIGKMFVLGNADNLSNSNSGSNYSGRLEEAKFAVNGLDVLREFEPDLSPFQRFTLSGDIDWYQTSQELVGQKIKAEYYWIHTNQQGAPIVMEDKHGKVAWKSVSNAFGETIVSTEKESLNIRLPGQYYDAETGMHYNYYRYYQPSTGRYTSADPLDLSGGLHRYNYANANPLNFIDPTGEAAQALVIPPAVIAAFYACGAAVAAAILIDILGEQLSRDFLNVPFIWPGEVRDGLLAEMDNPTNAQSCPSGECQETVDNATTITPEDVAAMSAEELSICHAAARRADDRSHPCYGGTCSADLYDHLNTVNSVCKPKPPRCRMFDSCESMNARIAAFTLCANTRKTLADTCFKGGDDGHQAEVVNNIQEADICLGMLPTCL